MGILSTLSALKGDVAGSCRYQSLDLFEGLPTHNASIELKDNGAKNAEFLCGVLEGGQDFGLSTEERFGVCPKVNAKNSGTPPAIPGKFTGIGQISTKLAAAL